MHQLDPTPGGSAVRRGPHTIAGAPAALSTRAASGVGREDWQNWTLPRSDHNTEYRCLRDFGSRRHWALAMNVAVRVASPSGGEHVAGGHDHERVLIAEGCLQVRDEGLLSEKLRFAQVFGPAHSQAAVFAGVCGRMADGLIDGRSACLVVAGPEHSERQFSLVGTLGEVAGIGLAPRLAADILDKMAGTQSDAALRCRIAVYQVMGIDRVRDLLSVPPERRAVAEECLPNGQRRRSVGSLVRVQLDGLTEALLLLKRACTAADGVSGDFVVELTTHKGDSTGGLQGMLGRATLVGARDAVGKHETEPLLLQLAALSSSPGGNERSRRTSNPLLHWLSSQLEADSVSCLDLLVTVSDTPGASSRNLATLRVAQRLALFGAPTPGRRNAACKSRVEVAADCRAGSSAADAVSEASCLGVPAAVSVSAGNPGGCDSPSWYDRLKAKHIDDGEHVPSTGDECPATEESAPRCRNYFDRTGGIFGCDSEVTAVFTHTPLADATADAAAAPPGVARGEGSAAERRTGNDVARAREEAIVSPDSHGRRERQRERMKRAQTSPVLRSAGLVTGGHRSEMPQQGGEGDVGGRGKWGSLSPLSRCLNIGKAVTPLSSPRVAACVRGSVGAGSGLDPYAKGENESSQHAKDSAERLVVHITDLETSLEHDVSALTSTSPACQQTIRMRSARCEGRRAGAKNQVCSGAKKNASTGVTAAWRKGEPFNSGVCALRN